MLETIAVTAAWVVGVGAGITTLVAGGRWLIRNVRRVFQKISLAFDTLLGREAIVHPDTNEVLVPATPGLGTRLAHMEVAIDRLSQVHEHIIAVAKRVDVLSDRLEQHINEHR